MLHPVYDLIIIIIIIILVNKKNSKIESKLIRVMHPYAQF